MFLAFFPRTDPAESYTDTHQLSRCVLIASRNEAVPAAVCVPLRRSGCVHRALLAGHALRWSYHAEAALHEEDKVAT